MPDFQGIKGIFHPKKKIITLLLHFGEYHIRKRCVLLCVSSTVRGHVVYALI